MALRNVTSFVPRTVKSILTRLIGGLDIRGNGVDHPLLGLDPFVLCDAAPEIPGIGSPPFGFHPHYGLIAITYVLDGSFDDEDNLSTPGETPQRHINVKGSICMASSGQGMCHSEKSASEGNNGVMQTIVRIPHSKLHLPPAIRRAHPSEIPRISIEGGSFELLVGINAGMESPACLPAMPRFILGRVEVPPGSTVRIPLDEDLDHGFVYILGGSAGGSVIGGHPVQPDGGAYLFESGGALEVSHSPGANSPLELFLGAGVKMDAEPWVKLLGHNGFIIAKDESDAQRVMSKIDEVGQKFTYKDFE